MLMGNIACIAQPSITEQNNKNKAKIIGKWQVYDVELITKANEYKLNSKDLLAPYKKLYGKTIWHFNTDCSYKIYETASGDTESGSFVVQVQKIILHNNSNINNNKTYPLNFIDNNMVLTVLMTSNYSIILLMKKV